MKKYLPKKSLVISDFSLLTNNNYNSMTLTLLLSFNIISARGLFKSERGKLVNTYYTYIPINNWYYFHF